MRRPLRHVTFVLMGCFVILFAQLNRWQIYQADALIDHPSNTQVIRTNVNRERGRIITRDGVVVAESQETSSGSFARQRVYPHGDLYAHTAGYMSFTFGAAGVEKTYNEDLIGEQAQQRRTGIKDLLEDRDPVGEVVLTIDHELQELARTQLGNRKGSIVALSPTTGEIYAMWGFPSFDPNSLAINDGEKANENWTNLNEAPNNPALARPYREIFFPGSTFKIVTAAAALENGLVQLDSPEFKESAQYVPPQTTVPIPNFAGSTCGGSLGKLIERSCNTGIAQLAAETIGPERLVNQAQSFGFNQTPPIDLPEAAASVFPTDFGRALSAPGQKNPAGIYEDTPALAQSSLGQNDVSATPLQMALVAAAVSNGGQMPQPHVMLRVEDVRTREVTREFDTSKKWKQATSAGVAADLTTAMIRVVEGSQGTAKVLATDDLVVGAKTGTAQAGKGKGSHAWIIAFAGQPQQPPEIALAVIVEADPNLDQSGGKTAAPIAKELLNQFFNNVS